MLTMQAVCVTHKKKPRRRQTWVPAPETNEFFHCSYFGKLCPLLCSPQSLGVYSNDAQQGSDTDLLPSQYAEDCSHPFQICLMPFQKQKGSLLKKLNALSLNGNISTSSPSILRADALATFSFGSITFCFFTHGNSGPWQGVGGGLIYTGAGQKVDQGLPVEPWLSHGRVLPSGLV